MVIITCGCISTLAENMLRRSAATLRHTVAAQKLFVKKPSLRVEKNLKIFMLSLKKERKKEEVLHPCFPTSFCAQTPRTIKSNTFNHWKLKPEEKDKKKIRTVTRTGQQTDSSTSEREEPQVLFTLRSCLRRGDRKAGGGGWGGKGDLRCLLRCGASRRVECRTRSPRSRRGPKRPAWRSSRAARADVCSPSGTCCS